MSHPGEASGFSLFELIVVLILVGAASAVVAVSFLGSFGSLQLETSTRDLITHMKQARSEAVAQQSVRRVVFLISDDPKGGHGYIIADDYEQPLATYLLPRGIQFAEIEELQPQVSFYPNGRSSGGTVQLKNENGKTLRIEVDPVTGFGKVRKEDLES